jgi:hypothetical protein
MTYVKLPLYTSAAIAVLLSHGSVPAQSMTDPTRPHGASDAGADVEALNAPVLQSIMITGNRRAAIISGKRVELGERYGAARVMKITENEVVLRSAAGTEVLKMYPKVHKGPRGAEPGRAPGAVARERSAKG